MERRHVRGSGPLASTPPFEPATRARRAQAAALGHDSSMAEVRRLKEVGSEADGEALCEILRAAGIKCACVPLPSEAARTSALRFLTAPFDRGMSLSVIVAADDEERARAELARAAGAHSPGD
jgi:hypothetical protein